MTLSIRNHTTHILEHDEYGEFELPFAQNDYERGHILVKKTDKGYVIGGIAHDEDCPNPMESSDGMGKIGTSSRRDSREANQVYQDAVGLTRYWERKVSVTDMIEELADELDIPYHDMFGPAEDGKSAPLKKKYNKRIREINAQHEKDGDMGNPDRVVLDVYEHSGRTYSVGYNRNFPDRQFDCAYGGAVWVPDDEFVKELDDAHLTGKKRTAKLEERARGVIDEMNKWMAGDCYGMWTATYDENHNKLTDDSCWGFIGHEYAVEEMTSIVEHEAGEVVKCKHRGCDFELGVTAAAKIGGLCGRHWKGK